MRPSNVFPFRIAESPPFMSKSRHRGIATLIGFAAILMWALLAAFTIGTRGLAPFQLLGLTFAVAFAVSVPVIGRKGMRAFGVFRQPWPVCAAPPF